MSEALTCSAIRTPSGASGARLATTAINRLHQTVGRYELCTMFIDVGQGIADRIVRYLRTHQSSAIDFSHSHPPYTVHSGHTSRDFVTII